MARSSSNLTPKQEKTIIASLLTGVWRTPLTLPASASERCTAG